MLGRSTLLRYGWWLIALIASGTVAQGQALTWSVTLGFGGAYKEGAWAPVFVDIANRGESQVGEIRAWAS